jgi:hypothetical protein
MPPTSQISFFLVQKLVEPLLPEGQLACKSGLPVAGVYMQAQKVEAFELQV